MRQRKLASGSGSAKLATSILAGVFLLGVAAADRSAARVFLTIDEALALAFPDCEIERTTVYLTQEQRRRAEQLARVDVRSRLVHAYVAHCGEEAGGVAYFDTHLVRTHPETLMIAVGPDGAVNRVEILSFQEPEDYIPRDAWYRQFLGEPLGDELEIDRKIRPVTGATLTARATSDAVRRALAVHRVVHEESP